MKAAHFRQEGKSFHLGTFKTNEFWDPLLLRVYGKPPCKATSKMWAWFLLVECVMAQACRQRMQFEEQTQSRAVRTLKGVHTGEGIGS